MATLGDAFSDDERRKSVARQLQPGTIIYLDVAFSQGRRPKFLVVAHIEHECCTFIVNSRITPFIEAHPKLAVCQVKIDAARHPCFRHDSHIACHELLRLPTPKVIAELVADLSRIKGNLHPEVVAEVVAAVKRAPTLSPAEQTRIADALAKPAAGGN